MNGETFTWRVFLWIMLKSTIVSTLVCLPIVLIPMSMHREICVLKKELALYHGDASYELVDKESNGKTTIVRNENIRGVWFEDDRCVMALIIEQKSIHKAFKSALPFVEIYLKNADGEVDYSTVPYGLSLQGGELNLQLISGEHPKGTVVSMSMIDGWMKRFDDGKKREHEHRLMKFNPNDPLAMKD